MNTNYVPAGEKLAKCYDYEFRKLVDDHDFFVPMLSPWDT